MSNPNKDYFKWTIEIEVHKTWVEDGFDLTKNNVHDRVMGLLPYAYGHEVRAKVLTAPPDEAVAECQGYPSVEQYQARKL